MVFSRATKFEEGFPSRVISTVVEKFSAGVDSKNLNREGRTERGRRMVAEELKLSKVDVKGRQQQFENMAQSKDTKIRNVTRSKSTENPAARLISTSRKARSVSAEPAQRSNVLQQSAKFGTTSGVVNRAGSVKKQNNMIGFKNSINVGKVADKFEKKSEASLDAGPTKRVISPVSGQNPSRGVEQINGDARERTDGPGALSKGPISLHSSTIEDRIKKLEKGEDLKKPKWFISKSGIDIRRSHLEKQQSEDTLQTPESELNGKREQQINGNCQSRVMKDFSKDIGFGKYNGANDARRSREIADAKNAKNSSASADKEKNDEPDWKSKMKAKGDRNTTIEAEEDVVLTKQGKTVMHENEKEQQVSSLGSEIVPTDDAPLQTRPRISTNTDDGESSPDKISESPPYEDPIPSKLERTPSMKILISTRAPKSPATQRSTAIVRVNSKSSEKGDTQPLIMKQSNPSSQEPLEDNEEVHRGSSSISLEEPQKRSNIDEGIELKQKTPAHRTESNNSVFDDESGYYGNVRSDLRGQRGLSPEKQRLLSELLSLENKDLAKSLGLSDELIELLREEEGYWKRQVELKKWRESHESKGKDEFGRKTFDPAKEKKIAELRKQHNVRQSHKAAEDDGLVEELHLAEQRLSAKETPDFYSMTRRAESDRPAPVHIVNNGSSISPSNKTIYLKQRQVGNGEARFNGHLPRRDNRYSYPPLVGADTIFGGEPTGMYRARPNTKSYDHLPRGAPPLPTEYSKVPSLNTISNGPITYFEHIANVQRRSLVAEPYASHPRRKSVESTKSVEPQLSGKSDGLRYSSHDSVFDDSRQELQVDGDIEVIDGNSNFKSPDGRGSFDVATESNVLLNNSARVMPEYGEQGSAFTRLRQQNHFTDPSYLSLLNNNNYDGDDNNNNNNYIGDEYLHTSVPGAGNQNETSIEGGRSYEPHFGEAIDGGMRTYHVTRVAVRYSRPGSSNEEGSVKKETTSQSSNSVEDLLFRPKSNESTVFSENDAPTNANYFNEYRSLSSEEVTMEELREAKLMVMKNTSKMRCFSCQMLISERAAMTVVDSGLFWHTTCFYCVVCGIMLVKTKKGSATQVRLIDNELHCMTCFSQDGGQLSEV